MLPFCGYNMADYFRHWLDLGHRLEMAKAKLPAIFCVNWFRTDEQGKFVWPGYSENMRVLQWMIGRIEGKAGGTEHVFGHSPRYEDLDWTGLEFSRADFDQITRIDKAQWLREFELHAELFTMLAHGLPHHLPETKAALEKRLAA
jgi:phosphoenolpyruvate carboxykinase (GTP)